MAVDKLVDSTQLDSDLTSVANAIRTKGGTSGSLAFPSGFVSAINAISGGGGGDYEIASGTFTPASASQTASVSVDFAPEHAICYCSNDDLGTGNTWKLFASVMFDTSQNGVRLARYGESNISVASVSVALFTYSDGSFTFSSGSNSYKFVSGVTYTWFCWRATT